MTVLLIGNHLVPVLEWSSKLNSQAIILELMSSVHGFRP